MENGVDGNSLIDHSGGTEHLNKTSWVEWEWKWALVGINQPGVLVGGRVWLEGYNWANLNGSF